MQYICTICGYMYDEAVEKVPFSQLPDDWTCPLCGASKDLFEPVTSKAEEQPQEVIEESIKTVEENEALNSGLTAKEMAALFSNLANGCEKQYEFEAQKKFLQLAKYFDDKANDINVNKEKLFSMLKEDATSNYAKVKEACKEDRGALRALTWGEKVTKVQQMMVSQGPDALEGKNLFVCSVCGFMYIGESAPKLCPVCKVPDWKFIKI